MSRCATRDKPFPLPPSLPIELARSHPRFKHWLEPGAQCELESGHIGPHRAGLLVWHDPPIVVRGSASS